MEFGLEIEDYESCFRDMLDTFRMLKSSAQETGKESEIVIGDLTLTVHGSGIRFYAYRLSCEDFTICFSEKVLLNNAPVWVKFSSGYLWSYSVTEAYSRFVNWFQVFNTDIVCTKVSRADICADTDEVSFSSRDATTFVTRAKSKSRHGVDDEFFEGKIFSGFTVGRGQPMLARIYLKSLEVKKSGKVWFYDVWTIHGWAGEREVWRTEFQLRREVLKDMGISSVLELLSQIDGVWAYCTVEWLTLRQFTREKNVSRRKVRKKWTRIQSARFEERTSPVVRTKVRQGNLVQLLNQAAGLTISIAAAGGYSSLDTTLQELECWTQERLRSRNATFNDEKNYRRNRFLR